MRVIFTARRGDRVGLRSAIGNRVCLKRAPWVRIPLSPLGRTLMTENRESRQSRKAATVADLQGVSGRPFFVFGAASAEQRQQSSVSRVASAE